MCPEQVLGVCTQQGLRSQCRKAWGWAWVPEACAISLLLVCFFCSSCIFLCVVICQVSVSPKGLWGPQRQETGLFCQQWYPECPTQAWHSAGSQSRRARGAQEGEEWAPPGGAGGVWAGPLEMQGMVRWKRFVKYRITKYESRDEGWEDLPYYMPGPGMWRCPAEWQRPAILEYSVILFLLPAFPCPQPFQISSMSFSVLSYSSHKKQ